jgi:hypothetical protein
MRGDVHGHQQSSDRRGWSLCQKGRGFHDESSGGGGADGGLSKRGPLSRGLPQSGQRPISMPVSFWKRARQSSAATSWTGGDIGWLVFSPGWQWRVSIPARATASLELTLPAAYKPKCLIFTKARGKGAGKHRVNRKPLSQREEPRPRSETAAPAASFNMAFGGSWRRSDAVRTAEGLGLGDELADVHSDVAGDCPEQSRRDVTTLVKRNGRRPPVRVSVLAVRTTLTDLNESQFGK